MKTVVITALIGMIITSCSKNNREGTNKIVGQWEYRKNAGGIAGTINYPPGNGYIQVFAGNNNFSHLHADTITISGAYSIHASGRQDKWLLQKTYLFNGQQQTSTDTVRFEGNQLIYLPASLCCDMPTLYFERINGKP